MSVVKRTLLAAELTTGRRLVGLPFSGGQWSVSSGAAGSITATIPLDAAEFRRVAPVVQGGLVRWLPTDEWRGDIRVITEPTRTMLAVVQGDSIIEAGPIWVREWDLGAGTLTLRATGIRAVFDHRLLVSHLVDWAQAGSPAASSLVYSGLSLGTIAKRMVQEALAQTGGALPVVLPADVAGTHERSYPGYELAMVGQRLSELSAVENGPEIQFDPRLTSDRQGIEFAFRHGSEADPALHQSGMDWVVDTTVPRGVLGGLRVTEDASNMTLRAIAKGPGTAKATLISRAATSGLLAAGYPLLDSVRSYTSDTQSQSSLDANAAGDLDANDRPWQTWNLTVKADDRMGQVRIGDWWAVRLGGGPFLPAGTYRSRLAAMSGALGGDTVDLTLAPTEVPL